MTRWKEDAIFGTLRVQSQCQNPEVLWLTPLAIKEGLTPTDVPCSNRNLPIIIAKCLETGVIYICLCTEQVWVFVIKQHERKDNMRVISFNSSRKKFLPTRLDGVFCVFHRAYICLLLFFTWFILGFSLPTLMTSLLQVPWNVQRHHHLWFRDSCHNEKRESGSGMQICSNLLLSRKVSVVFCNLPKRVTSLPFETVTLQPTCSH